VPERVKVTVEPKNEVNLRKLARALIALAEQSLDEESKTPPATREAS
jgi:hypothetical protein